MKMGQRQTESQLLGPARTYTRAQGPVISGAPGAPPTGSAEDSSTDIGLKEEELLGWHVCAQPGGPRGQGRE